MQELTELFNKCAYTMIYEQVGDSVNYAFEEVGDELYIYFQGSNSTTDWIRNFWFPAKPYKNMDEVYRVHRGFLKCWKSVEDIIIDKITEKTDKGDYKYKKIYSIGYSHGGALSGFCHECVWYHRPDIRDDIRGYGFESPRFYAGLFCRRNLLRRWEHYHVIRNHIDIVTHVPPIIFGFKHVGTIIKIGKKAKYGPIKSHYPNNVLDSLKKAAEELDK